MVQVTGEQLQKTSGFVRAEARRAPVEVTYHGRPELVVMSVEDYALLRQNRKLAFVAHRHADRKNRADRQQPDGSPSTPALTR